MPNRGAFKYLKFGIKIGGQLSEMGGKFLRHVRLEATPAYENDITSQVLHFSAGSIHILFPRSCTKKLDPLLIMEAILSFDGECESCSISRNSRQRVSAEYLDDVKSNPEDVQSVS